MRLPRIIESISTKARHIRGEQEASDDQQRQPVFANRVGTIGQERALWLGLSAQGRRGLCLSVHPACLVRSDRFTIDGVMGQKLLPDSESRSYPDRRALSTVTPWPKQRPR